MKRMSNYYLEVSFVLYSYLFILRKKETALHWAVRRSAIDIIKALMEHGADPCLASSTGATPMGMALESNSKEIATLMNGILSFFIFINLLF